MTRHHALIYYWQEILIFSIDSGVRQWFYPLMIPLYYLWAKANNIASSQFESDVLAFIFVLISFVDMHDAVAVL